MPQRYEINIDNVAFFVEFSDAWSYTELRNVDKLNDAELMAFLAKKMIAVDLPVDGDSLSTPERFAQEWESLDVRAYNWIVSVSIQERSRIGRLGETILRESLRSFVETQTTAETLADQDK